VQLEEEEITARYHWIEKMLSVALHKPSEAQKTWTEILDRILLHRFFGPIIFFATVSLMFQSVFSWASYPMDIIDAAFSWASTLARQFIPVGFFQDLVTDGILAGAGSVVIFLPQILLLFLFIGILEDTGYMARAAFIMDRLMSKVGLSGKSFIPLLSSFACAIPGIMACRTIEHKKDRFTTILVAPLTTCSARLPVYVLLIGAFIPATPVLLGFDLQGVMLFSLYILGILGVIGMAWVFRKTVFRGESPPLILELPTYKLPQPKVVLRNMWNKSRMFVRRAGTIILGISVLLWFLSSYPKNPELEKNLFDLGATQEVISAQLLRQSFAGKLGQFIEPLIQPLGFDWKIGIGLIGSFAAREVFVSTLGTIYQVGEADETSLSLRESLQKDHQFNALVAISLLVFYVFACQCMSTVAITRRETNSWVWPLFMVGYMTALAYMSSLAVYQIGKLLFPTFT
ncbi:MAG: ferrous iron transport protein B, partial [Deltaproteobacteria bacterium]|nr:ferrous iron transport protein B [Deltaproteobacteria bacterium]